MEYLADFHLHSRFSRATSRELDLEHLYRAAQMKGITVIGTGDVTHPEWFAELCEKLVPAEDGLYALRPELAAAVDGGVPPACRRPVRFLLAGEISNIYKKDGQTRKNHNLVFLPDMETADRFRNRLAAVGNVASDGRPILGLDARDLLDMVLTVSAHAFLVPAHIWTPWFSMLGSKSGFDSVEACFGDLAEQVFALETGLSSDPAMNWRVSRLDRYTLMSNSDAHSAMKIGRECNRFDTELGFSAIRRALDRTDATGFLGTVEFYPEEGKYHYDGHRKCGLCLDPSETRRVNGICPKCGKPLTLGVLYRVEELADRSDGTPPDGARPFVHLVPLQDILSELLQKGPQTKTVGHTYRKLLDDFGSEFFVLLSVESEDLDRSGVPLLGEAIRRMRRNEMAISPGFDGEFGKVCIFSADERRRLLGQRRLFSVPSDPAGRRQTAHHRRRSRRLPHQTAEPTPEMPTLQLNAAQQSVVSSETPRILVVAGPGTGKTHTLIRRLAHLIGHRNVSPDQILAVTFTAKAAAEMRERLAIQLGDPRRMPLIETFHAFCYRMLTDALDAPPILIDDAERRNLLVEARNSAGVSRCRVDDVMMAIARAKQQLRSASDDPDDGFEAVSPELFQRIYARYERLLRNRRLWDFDDLIGRTVHRIETDAPFRRRCRDRSRHLFIDEYQDLNHAQYRLTRLLHGNGGADRTLCAIGDPDQSIYGFRGSKTVYFERFSSDFPGADIIRLTRNYRSSDTILRAAHQLMAAADDRPESRRVTSGIDGAPTIGIIEAPTERSEAVAIGRRIERMVGGTGFHAIDFNRVDGADTDALLGFSDVAVLFRTGRQSAVFEEVFTAAGIPYQVGRRTALLERDGVAELLAALRLIHGCGSLADLTRLCRRIDATVSTTGLLGLSDTGTQPADPLAGSMSESRTAGLDSKTRRVVDRICRNLSSMSATRDGMAVADQIRRITESGPVGSVDEAAIHVLIEIGKRHGEDARRFLADVAMADDADLIDRKAEKVSLLTLHAAKGLEFSVVFVAGCEDGWIPHPGSRRQPTDPMEERRLLYVALTRARQRLFLTWSRQRRIHGKVENRRISRLVRDVDAALLTSIRTKTPKPAGRHRQIGLFPGS